MRYDNLVAIDSFLGLLGFVIYVLTLLLFAMKAMKARLSRLYLLGAALIIGALVSFVYGFGLAAVVSVLFGIVLFNLILSKELRGVHMPAAVLGLVYLLVFYQNGPVALSLAMALGVSSELLSEIGSQRKVSNAGIELRRDFVHLFGGIILFLLFFGLSYNFAGYAADYIFIIGILVVFYAELWRSNRLSMSLYKIEKHKGYVGYGAIWLGIGTLLSYVFLDKSFFLLALAAIYFADPVATFVGTYWKSFRLPWNRKKSLYGSVSYFAIVAVLGYPLVGPFSLLFALVGAAVESLALKLDDNFSVAVALVALYYLLAFAGV